METTYISGGEEAACPRRDIAQSQDSVENGEPCVMPFKKKGVAIRDTIARKNREEKKKIY